MSFPTLPAEVQLLVISQCLQASPPQPPSSSSTPEPPPFNAHQAAMLAAVSRSCNATVTKLLYGQIRITRPSSLRQLHATLTRRSDLAALVTSIHLGPDKELVKHAWPIAMAKEQHGDWPELYIKNSISTSEASLLPLWCKPGAKVRLSNPQSHDGKGKAIHEAMAAAMKALDVEPWRRRFSWSKAKIGLGQWTARLLLLQAALDLFLMQMRRVEDGQGRAAAQVEYPRFRILPQLSRTTNPGDSQSQGSANPGEFVVTEESLWQHLQRVGGPGDHFDSLFRLARSTKKTLDMDREEWGRLRIDLGGPYADKLTNREWQDVMDYDGDEEELERLSASSEAGAGDTKDLVQEADEVEEADSERFEADDLYSYGGWSSDDEEPASISHQSRFDGVENLLQLAQSVLAMTSQVNNVSLTSYLFRALPTLAQPERLRSLNIGPKPFWWDQTFPASVPEKLNKLVRLRVVGHISEEDATTMCDMLPSLEHLQWTERSDVLNNLFYANCINQLQGQGDPDDGWHAAITLGKRRRESFEDESPRPTTSRIASSRRRILVLVHPREFSTIGSWTTDQWTDSTETCEVWLRGDPVPGTLHTVKVMASETVEWPAEIRDAGSEAREVAALYAEGRKWWEEGHAQRVATVQEDDEPDEAKAGNEEGGSASPTS